MHGALIGADSRDFRLPLDQHPDMAERIEQRGDPSPLDIGLDAVAQRRPGHDRLCKEASISGTVSWMIVLTAPAALGKNGPP